METYLLVDCGPSILQRTYAGLTKLEFARTLCGQIADVIFRAQKPAERVFVFDSVLHKTVGFDQLAGFQNPAHLANRCQALKMQPQSSLFDSLQFLLRFHRFMSFDSSNEGSYCVKLPQRAHTAHVC
jgi:hypothetical protein